MHGLDEAQIGAGKLAKHLDAEIGDEPVAEIVHRDIADIFGNGLDHRDHNDGGGDPVDHLLVLGDEHVIGRLLDEEGNGAGSRRRKDHGERGEQQQREPWPQMLAPDAQHDRASRIFDLELVGAPGNGADVSEQLVFQYFPRFTAPRLEGAAAV